MLDLRECLSLDVDNLPPAVYLSTLQTPQPFSDGYDSQDFWLCLPKTLVATEFETLTDFDPNEYELYSPKKICSLLVQK